MKEKFVEALKELRKSSEKRKFEQTIDLIINLKNFDIRKESVSLFIPLPHESTSKKICAFLETPSEIFDKVITKPELEKWKDKKKLKGLAKDYSFFVAIAPLMPTIAMLFGKTLGPLGKMPDPKAGGVLMRFNEQEA